MSDTKKSWWEKYWINPWYGFFVVTIIAAAICLIQTQQYVAEKTGEALWWILGGGLVGLAVWFLIKANKTSEGRGG